MNEYRVFGPPGCGKTTRIYDMLRQAVADYGARSVIAASLTKTAAQELTGRDLASLDIGKDQANTLHSLCYHLLGTPKLATQTAALADWNADHHHYRLSPERAKFDAPYDESGADSEYPGDALRQRYDLYRARMVPRIQWEQHTSAFADAWDPWKQHHGVIDFTDMIELAYLNCDDPPHNAAVLFVDEAQDCNTLEWALIRKWAQRLDKLVTAGDDDQAMYIWRGADPVAFLSPIPADQKTFLGQSFRVPKAVHAVAARVAQAISFREQKPYQPTREQGVFDDCRATWTNPDPLIPLLEQHHAHRETVAVLAPCQYMLGPLLKQLKADGIPFHNAYRPDWSPWNPLDTKATRTVLAWLAIEKRWWTYRELVLWADQCDKTMFHRGAKKDMKAQADVTPAALVPLDQLMGWVLHPDFDTMAESPDGLTWWLGRCTPTNQKTLVYPVLVASRFGQAALTSAPWITVGTVHSIKGGEAKHVYFFPDLSNAAAVEYSQRATRDPIHRLVYVALTRAQYGAHWCQPAGRLYIQHP